MNGRSGFCFAHHGERLGAGQSGNRKVGNDQIPFASLERATKLSSSVDPLRVRVVSSLRQRMLDEERVILVMFYLQ